MNEGRTIFAQVLIRPAATLYADEPFRFELQAAAYSDITALHCALWQQAGLVTFHGPMLNADFVTHKFPAFTANSFFRTLTQPLPPGSICQGYRAGTVRVLRGGVASGELIGGNLTMLCALLGTPWQPSFRRKILFFEDVNEPPYRYDRLLTQLLNAGLLRQVAGVAVGLNHGCEEPALRRPREFRQTLEDILRERLLPLKVPVVIGLPFGHVAVNATLPIGLTATLDGRAGDLVITASAVR
jgi:muramoyltetrapeptide carboxypeptidase